VLREAGAADKGVGIRDMKMNVLLIKPHQVCAQYTASPPLGLLYLAATLREDLGDRVDVRVVDARLRFSTSEDLADEYRNADIIGISAMNLEAPEAFAIARKIKSLHPDKIVVLGGPIVQNRAKEVLQSCEAVDWVFEGESERAFPEAVARQIAGEPPSGETPGMYYRQGDTICSPPRLDVIDDLDSLPLPAWDLLDVPAYSQRQNMLGFRKGKRYAAMFTSRGCPYSCGYCHDIFGRKTRWRSAESVLAEIELLRSSFGVDEFHIYDDIFNLNKKRLRQIFNGVAERYGEDKPYFCFPNGLRGDLLDEEDIKALKRGGAYHLTVAIETASPRLQKVINKRLNLEKVTEAIRLCDREGLLVRGFFMVGLPTETPDEIKQTIRFAWRSRLTMASFFTFVPQPKTPLYDMARAEGPEALVRLGRGDYFGPGWYEMAHGYPIGRVSTWAYLVFFLTPWRFFRLARSLGWKRVLAGGWMMLELIKAFNFSGRARTGRSATGPDVRTEVPGAG
jgi:radical SAM superfamily enzyme YgiQ (UPF0313 family)